MKYLLLILIIIAALFYSRVSNSRREPSPHTTHSEEQSGSLLQITYLVIGIIVLSVGWAVVSHWIDYNRQVQVKVIHIQSGNTTTYTAKKGHIHHRSFKTIDDREVQLADMERMEVLPEP
ncbi:hypothetical protein ACQZV8_06605 [Magnetococcales bacterium HHB-1]